LILAFVGLFAGQIVEWQKLQVGVAQIIQAEIEVVVEVLFAIYVVLLTQRSEGSSPEKLVLILGVNAGHIQLS
jgi:hypothetical protein